MTKYIKGEWKRSGKSLKTVILLFSFVIIAMTFFFPKLTRAAEESIKVKEINYQNSTITLQVNSDDSIIYFSDSLKRTWEIVPGNIKSDRTIVMDISWVSLIKNYVMTFKGDSSAGITTVVLPKQVTNFKASFNKVKGTISFKNAGRRTIEWRKKDSMIWNTVNIDTISTELGYFYTNGATIYFRLAPVNGSGSDNLGYRASKEIAVNIPKKIAAPSVKINGSKLNITAKKGIAYRIVNMDGSVSDWITLRSSTDLLLSDIASRALYSNNAASQEEVTLQFRSNATSTTQVSNIATIIVPIQEGQPDEDRQGISLAYSSSTTLSLQVKAASSTNPFEYTIIKQNSELNYKTAKWTAITSSTSISIKKNAAPQGSHIYIRKKSIEASEEIDFSLASAEKDITGANGITYPEAPTTSTIKTLITTAGVCKEGNGSGTLTFTLYSPTATTVSTIDFHDVYGNMKGSVTSKSSVSVNNNSTGYNDKYIITTKITSTSSIDTHTNELLYANITMENYDTIISTSTSGIHLYMYSNTAIGNPDSSYSSDFKRIYLSNEEEDASKFKFQINFGTDKTIDTSTINTFTSEATAVTSITYSGYTLVKDTDYTIEYSSITDMYNKTIATAIVTVNVAAFESYIPITKLDQKNPLIIKLNSNEILDKDINLTLVSTARMEDIPIAWSITEGSLSETRTSKVTNSDGSTTSVTEDVITYTINLTIFDNLYPVSVADVTWGDASVLGSATISSGTATIYLSNAKINKLTTNATDTKNIVITLSNGFVIRSGCKLTIIKAY